jgi:hypothetical protein
MNNGWIKLFRAIKDKGFYKKSAYVHLWIHLLLKASHAPKEYFLNGETIKLKQGQFVTGRKALARETGINESSVQRILKVFEIEHQIEQVTNRQNRLISIVNWEKFQVSEQQFEHLVNNERTTSEQRMNTIKNEEKGKNVKSKSNYQNNGYKAHNRFDTGGPKKHENDRL